MCRGAAAAAEPFAANVSPSYDAAGNMTSDGIYNYAYDAWNRLVKVTRLGPTASPQVIATYAYDGLGRRYMKHVEGSGPASAGGRNRTEYFFYDNQWRVLETRNDQNLATRQYVWGMQYIDELICVDVDTNGDGDCTDEGESGCGFERYRYFQDANWNVVGIWADHAMRLVERYEYDPYGTCRIFSGWDSSAGCEGLSVIGESLVPGGNPIRYAGYYFDDETGMYHVRHRMYSPGLQRWLQRDPLGVGLPLDGGFGSQRQPRVSPRMQYSDGGNIYEYAGDMAIDSTDPSGLRRYERPGYKPKVNGCGPGDWRRAFVPNGISCGFRTGDPGVVGWIDFTQACNTHDECYGHCNSLKADCDKQ